MQRLTTASDWPVLTPEGLRARERTLQANTPTPLMDLAGLAAAKLALALAPHAQRIWVAAGPGNNGGDGLEAALHLHHWGKTVHVSLLASPERLTAEAQRAWQRARQAGVPITPDIPAWINRLSSDDLCIDALLGIGATRPLEGLLAEGVRQLNHQTAPVLALDLPTGLHPTSGQWLGGAPSTAVKAQHTLTFIAAKPGLFMGHGRDVCGQIWLATLDDNNCSPPTDCTAPGSARLNTWPSPLFKMHASHKGLHGDVAVIGGEPLGLRGTGMTGAAVLAATSALHAGAGRVLLGGLDGTDIPNTPHDVMQRYWQTLDLENAHVVCGCGGGQAIEAVLSAVLQRSAQLVLDADALNAVAKNTSLQALLGQRGVDRPTVITPHPLEAARLLACNTAHVQSDRLGAAQTLAKRWACTVVLKGSGTVIASPDQTPRINTTGNGRLAIGGTGDVLAGLVAARMAHMPSAFEAACAAVFQHGLLADTWPADQALTASRLAEHLS